MVLRHARSRLLSLLIVTLSLVMCQGCGPRAPIVSSPIDPWEEKLVQEKVAQREEAEEESRRVAARLSPPKREGLGKEEPPERHSIIVTTLADIVAFPLRGAAWLAHTIL